MKKIYFLLAFLVVLFLAVQNLNAQVSGTVFRDLPVNGTTANTYGVKDANELGVGGVTVTVYPGGTSTTTAADGTYSIAATGTVRVEFSGWPSYLKESSDAGGANSSVQFVVAPSSNINFGLHNPADYSQVNPRISTSVLYEGEATGAASGRYGHLSVPIEATGHHFQSNGNPTGAFQGTTIANFVQIGSTYGLAYQVTKRLLYLGAYQKRFSGYGPNGPDAIYMLDVNNNTVAGVIELDALTGVTGSTGTDPHDFITTSNGEILDLGVNNASFDGVGKIGFGDIEISEDDKTLFAVNLYDRKIYVIDISDGNAASASIIQTWDTPSPCGGGTISRPFALGVKDGKLFLGTTCEDASNSYVYSMDIDISNASAVWNLELTIPLQYTRQPILDSGTYSGSGPDDKWHGWVNDPTSISPLPETNSSHEIWYPQPILADIEFDDKGLILGFRDRFGDQTGTGLPLYMNSGLKWGTSGGDIIRACGTQGSYSLESGALGGGSCDASTGKNNSGVNGYEFYAWDLWALDGTPNPSGNGGNSGFHWETTQGGLVQLQGSGEVVTTDMDPQSDYSGGVLRLRNDGIRVGGGNHSFYTLYETGNYGNGGSPNALTFGKSSGLGDLELLSDPAPIEIGDRVWEDTDGDGVEDPGEPGVSGVTVELKQGGTTVATATTDANGNYIFSNDPNGTTTASHIYNLTQLEPNMDYTLTVPTSNGGNSLTTKNSGEGLNPEINDSDADTGTGEIQILASSIPVTGANNHSYDIGYAAQSTGLGIECWAISDENEADKQLGLPGYAQTDNLFKLDKVTGTWSLIGSTTVANEETVAYDPFNNELYSVNGDQMGRLNQTTGAFTAVSSNYGDVRLPDGSTHDIHDVDGLCFDPFGKVIWATERISDYNVNDLLFKIDASTHEIILNAFGPNVDAIPVQEAFDPILNKNVYDIDDIAVDPETGDLYAIQNEGGAGGVLTIINKTNGNVVINKGTFDEPGSSSSPVDDIEGLTFFNSGQLLASTGDNGPDSQDKNKLFLIDKNSAEVTPQLPIDPSGERFDFEALTCLTDEPNIMTGSLFLDDDCNGVFDGSDVVLDGYQINLYRDVSNNDVYDAGTDIFLTSTTTDASGAFAFEFKVASNSDFVITVDDPSSIPGYDHFSTTDVHEASFVSGGNTDSDNDFGVCVSSGSVCSVSESHTTECNDNGTKANENDDYFSLTVTGLVGNGSGNYVVKIGAYTSPSTPSGTAITIVGDGQGGNPNLAADGTSTYVVRVEDATDSTCFIEFTTEAVGSCSYCPAVNCGTATVTH